ncbi:uncharacterized protein LOC143292299 [Babylonia areolata]|uniref:uncharacterized protein LOC143292299 n=1 Tax=Babylonia areolata TaxID=304850 RepID=UPI003FD236F5
MKEPRESLLYLLPKIHKVNNPGRPIVSACACPTALISAFLDSVFQPLVAALPTYVKYTNHNLNLLNDFSFPADCTERHAFTMDIVSLYTNIPHQEGMLAVKHFLPKSSLRLHFPTILHLTELVLTLNSSFDQDHFQQQSGVAMGTKMGPSFPCLFVGFIEEQAFRQYKGVRPAFYKRFIDDCLGIATGPVDSLQAFIDFMSNFHPALKFTHTISNCSVPFLDILVTIQPTCNFLTTSVFYKETDSHLYLLYSSSHPQACKNSIPFSQLLRLRRICSDELDFEHQAERMVGFFLARQYPEALIQRGLDKARAIPRSQAPMPQEHTEKDERIAAVLTLHPHNLPVRSILSNNFHLLKSDTRLSGPPLPPGTSPCGRKGCKTCPFVDTSTTLTCPTGKFTVRAHFDCQSENLVYILTCTLCAKKYTDETYRSLNERFTEHLCSMRLGYSDPVGSHFNSPLHSFAHARIAVVWQNQSTGLASWSPL